MRITSHWRAVCGRTASTVRREGRLVAFPTPIAPTHGQVRDRCGVDGVDALDHAGMPGQRIAQPHIGDRLREFRATPGQQRQSTCVDGDGYDFRRNRTPWAVVAEVGAGHHRQQRRVLGPCPFQQAERAQQHQGHRAAEGRGVMGRLIQTHCGLAQDRVPRRFLAHPVGHGFGFADGHLDRGVDRCARAQAGVTRGAVADNHVIAVLDRVVAGACSAGPHGLQLQRFLGCDDETGNPDSPDFCGGARAFRDECQEAQDQGRQCHPPQSTGQQQAEREEHYKEDGEDEEGGGHGNPNVKGGTTAGWHASTRHARSHRSMLGADRQPPEWWTDRSLSPSLSALTPPTVQAPDCQIRLGRNKRTVHRAILGAAGVISRSPTRFRWVMARGASYHPSPVPSVPMRARLSFGRPKPCRKAPPP